MLAVCFLLCGTGFVTKGELGHVVSRDSRAWFSGGSGHKELVQTARDAKADRPRNSGTLLVFPV